MDIFNEIYYKGIAENERTLKFWYDYLKTLKSLDFNVYNEKLKVSALVPIGSRILFRGELKHTNEVTVALGADYFVKCSLKQAEVLRQHRIKAAQEKVDTYNKEKEYLQKQITFTKQNINENQGHEIIEYHTAEEDKSWREKHSANVKKYMQNRKKNEDSENQKDDITDADLWNRLEELELQEELENELNKDVGIDNIRNTKNELFVVEEGYTKIEGPKVINPAVKDDAKAIKEIQNMKVLQNAQPSKLDLLQQVIDRQNELDEKIQELKNRERNQSRTEQDIMSRIDELEQLDELEDEIDRLDDIIENEDVDESEEEVSRKSDTKKLQRRVSFIDEDDSETLHLTFNHSNVESDNTPYDPEKGIQKPSDIYKAYSKFFANGTQSILKKSKNSTGNDTPDVLNNPVIRVEEDVVKQPEQLKKRDLNVHQTIVIKDVVEKGDQNSNTLQTETKPMSLFKKKRMQSKTS